MKIAAAHWHELALLGAAVVLVAAIAFAWRMARTKDPDEAERERRAFLNRIGRIVDGQVVEVVEKPEEEANHPASMRRGNASATDKFKEKNRKLLVYSYTISGVTYEAAQDVTGLEERACLDRVVAGQPTGIKYDPSNPSNSILIADDWSGLH